MNLIKSSFSICLLFVFVYDAVFAQDTTKKQTIEIISSYKPVYREVTKLNLTASPLPSSITEKLPFTYKLPVRPLYMQFIPSSIKPLRQAADTMTADMRNNYFKLGYGNFVSPVLEGGFSFKPGERSSVQLTGDHFSQRGPLRVQRYSRTFLAGHYAVTGERHTFNSSLSYTNQSGWLYAKDSTLQKSPDDSLRKPYRSVRMLMSLRNNRDTETKISYQPSLQGELFNDGRSFEKNVLIRVPVEMQLSEGFRFSVEGQADLTFFNPRDTVATRNHIYQIRSGLTVQKQSWLVKAGVIPVWSQRKFSFLPDLQVKINIKEEEIRLIAGWESSVRKNNYAYLASQNLWINQPLSQFNTVITDLYGGLEGSINRQVQYRVQFGVQQLRDQPLFENSKRSSIFEVKREARLRSLQTKGEILYKLDKQLEVGAGIQVNNFFGQQSEAAPWHLLPFQVNGHVNWHPVKKIGLYTDLYAWRGGVYKRNISGDRGRLPSVLDLNAGADYQVSGTIIGWLQFSNLLNNRYQRWNLYPTFGFQVHAGIKLIFGSNLFK